MPILYFFIAALEIIAAIFQIQWLVYCTKPLLMLILAVYFYQNAHKPLVWTDKVILAALFFSLCGDVFLMFPDGKYFIFGLGSFLLAHVCYILVFSTVSKLNIKTRIPVFVYTIGMIVFLKSYVPENMFIPVLVYALTIGIMGMRALERNTNAESYRLVAIGAVLFIISDTLIAINKFVQPLPISALWVMSTYVIGQFLIIKGYLKES